MARRYCLLGTCDPGVLTWTIVPAEDSLCTLHGGCPQVATLLDILFLFCVSVREQAGFFFFGLGDKAISGAYIILLGFWGD